MNHTYTPLIIEGKIYVVVDAPEPQFHKEALENYNQQMHEYLNPVKYPTLPEHAPYWKERIGQRVEGIGLYYDRSESYAIPPQQKQGDISEAALTAVEELLIKHRSIFDGLDIPHDQKKALLLHFNYSTQY